MKEFRRGLNTKRIEALEKLVASKEQNWWKDLLRYWRPAGEPAGELGLRLAIRDNYLNFYRKGQSVARVHFDKDGSPCTSVHLKYLGMTNVPKGKEYARLQGNVFVSKEMTEEITFCAGSTIEKIIRKTKEHAGTEKHFVDIAFADNPNAVDLEICLPKQQGLNGAPRMDLAILEKNPTNGQIELVFWEAKTIDDNRLASMGSKPEVVEQLEKYEEMMASRTAQDNVAEQYKKTCTLLTTLADMARRCENEVTLSELITEAAKAKALTVSPKPRLVVFEGTIIIDDNPAEAVKVNRVSTWPEHQRKLTEKCGVFLRGPFASQPYVLKS
jgi:hypothetical protein